MIATFNWFQYVSLDKAFEASLTDLKNFDWHSCERLGLNAYAPATDDTRHASTPAGLERINGYRALGFARGVGLGAGHDEDQMAIAANAKRRPLQDLIAEVTCSGS